MKQIFLLVFIIVIPILSCQKEQEIKYYKSGSIEARIDLDSNGVPNGPFETFYQSGVLRSKGNWVNGIGNGYRERYYENGQIKEISYWRNRKLHGGLNLFFPNGSAQLKANYVEGKKIGIYKIFNKDGTTSEIHLFGPNEELYYLVKFSNGRKDLEFIFPSFQIDSAGESLRVTGQLQKSFSGMGIISVGHLLNNQFVPMAASDTVTLTEREVVFEFEKFDRSLNSLYYNFIYEPSASDTMSYFNFDKKIIKEESEIELQDDAYFMDYSSDPVDAS